MQITFEFENKSNHGKRDVIMKDWQLELQRQWYEACYLSGVKQLSDDECCQVLAWTYIYGSEECIYNLKFNGAIMAAQKRHKILGSETPSAETVLTLQKYIKSVSDLEHPPEWVYELEQMFGIKLEGAHK
jgi:hypothetical protein